MSLKIVLEKLKESMISVLPIAAIVIILSLTPIVSISTQEIILFAICTVLMILGIALFNVGADLSMTPMGEYIGSALVRSKKLSLLIFVCFLMGFLVTVAEPDLAVLASQLKEAVDSKLLLIFVGVGVGLFLVAAVLKIVFRQDLPSLYLFFYLLMFAVTALVILTEHTDMLALAFDSGGVTTGPMTVPFIIAIGVGVAAAVGGKNIGENSFGLVSLCAIGPVIAVLILAISSNAPVDYVIPDYSFEISLEETLIPASLGVAKSVSISMLSIYGFFMILQILFLKLPQSKIASLTNGMFISYIGLVLFLSSVTIGFMSVGYNLGTQIAEYSETLLVAMGFVLGAVVVLAEPSVHVLTNQVEEVTNGLITRRSLLVALSCGVGLSIGLSMLRIVYDFSLLFYLIPGYLLALGLTLLVPKIYTGIAFDAGGVASGPLASSFILPLTIGACVCINGEDSVLYDAFGVIAMISMTPVICIQTLGFRSIVSRNVRKKLAIRRVFNAEDRQIIRFMD